ncbi:Bile salt sulfotransferase 1 [Portunus trituberculatus]|uniref:Bile salt sulfotransferase 1 n=1 Tax=Portunus trituberculatus TaxID=210409 RepID=A0A5B7ID92_PORTR|nr:Bile salt sulfotransferase 1 [Portunus trituberculatus]
MVSGTFWFPSVIFGPYWRHVQEAWEQREHPNLRFVFYEDLKADTMTHLQRLNDFTGANLTQSQLDTVSFHALSVSRCLSIPLSIHPTVLSLLRVYFS